ncbi:MAG: N-acetylmuramoyl-L-alanine amidase [Phycisphaeraceae bacterium]|nr:MAG: N-acetylmuramoyl-L-alanine amidase [Phycisphaeraceae bacterium]
MTHQDDQTGRPALGRRELLGIALGTGFAAGLSALLPGCSTSTRHTRIGEPIPTSPIYRPLPGRSRIPDFEPAPQPTPGVAIIGRRTWATQGPIVSRADNMGRISYITVHHDGMSPFTSTLFDDAARRIEAIRAAHVDKLWADIGYHYAIDPAGRIWAARPESLQGAHVKDHNPHNLGIVVLGNYEQQRPTDAAIRSIDNLVAMKMDENRVPVNRVFTHREWAPTACPGRHVQSYMLIARARGGAIHAAAAGGVDARST